MATKTFRFGIMGQETGYW